MNPRVIETLKAARDGRLIEIDMQFTRMTEDQMSGTWLPCDGKSRHTQPALSALKLRHIYMSGRHSLMPDYRWWSLTRHGQAALAALDGGEG